MKYRNENYMLDQKGNTVFPGQDFEHYQMTYRYNPDTMELEESGLENTDELVESSRDAAFQSLLDKFLPGFEGSDDGEVAYDPYVDDLERMSEISQRAEFYKEKFNLDPSISIEEVFTEVGKRAHDLSNKIKNTGGVDNGKEIVQKSEQEAVSQNGEKG